MNIENEKFNNYSNQNHSSALEENLFQKPEFTPGEDVGNESKPLPNSLDLIKNESGDAVPSINSLPMPNEISSEKPNNENQSNSKPSTTTEIQTCENELEPLKIGDSLEGPDSDEDSDVKECCHMKVINLPQTTILLDTQWGSKVYVVGTAHFSEESQKDVAEVIRAVRPNVVVLELCKSRSHMLKWNESDLLKMAEKMDLKTVRETIQNYGTVQGALQLLLLSVSADITREMGMAPGGEFRKAYKEAMNIPGCAVHLGDRPIEITLRRAFSSISWWQAIKFACYALFSKKKIDEKDIEKFKNQDYLEEMLGCFDGEFPELKKVFVNERDVFLSVSLWNAALCMRGPEGIYPITVVGVVGMGHLRGIQENWGKIDPEEFQRSLKIPPPSKLSRAIKFTFKVSLLCLAVYGAHRLASRWQPYSSLIR